MVIVNILLMVVFVFSTKILAATSILNFPNIAKPNCTDHCGNISIPYPFGMHSDNCYENFDLFVTCNETYDPPKLFVQNSNIEITEISLDGQLTLLQSVARDCYRNGTRNTTRSEYEVEFHSSFTVNNTANIFTLIGCDTWGYISGPWNDNQPYDTGCYAMCSRRQDLEDGSCEGRGCCQIIDITKGMRNVTLSLGSGWRYRYVSHFTAGCSYGFLAKADAFMFHTDYVTNGWDVKELPMVVDWAIGNRTCEAARANVSSYACRGPNSDCYDPDNGYGYRCRCDKGYRGNPYLHGCQEVDECTDYMLNNCTIGCTNTIGGFQCHPCLPGYNGTGIGIDGCHDINECLENLHNCTRLAMCHNNDGGFNCTCPIGYSGNGVDRCVLKNADVYKRVAGGASAGIILLLFVTCFSYYEFKRRKSNKKKQECFLQNGGMLLQQKLCKREKSPNMAKIYSASELQKATNNFHKSMIIGQGGHGTVYKGSLEDKTVVAIKKSKEVIQSEIQQFINEVFVLSQVNHPNVVKLLGCCLETPAPLLVYEFIGNGTLFDHIRNERMKRSLDWNKRLKIAVETANVLSYLHSSTSTPIVHRDVKSANILLDLDFTTKVSDFGASRLVPVDQTQLSTMVQGTFGYLDPEYMLTNQLTEKSDVYSFGVVLIELLTSMKPLCYDRPEEDRNLANCFLRMLKQKRIFEIIDENIMNEGNRELIIEVALLAQRCINVRGEDRPSMKEVARELEGVKHSGKNSWVKSENNSEEMESLFCEAKSSGFDNYSASMGYDESLYKDHIVLLPMSGGR